MMESGNVAESQGKVMQNLEDLVIDTYNRFWHEPQDFDITLTRLYNEDPCKPFFIQRKVGFTRMRNACSVKCKISSDNYTKAEVVKKEAVCLDRCVYKYMCFHDSVGKRLARDEETFKSLLFPADVLKSAQKTEAES